MVRKHAQLVSTTCLTFKERKLEKMLKIHTLFKIKCITSNRFVCTEANCKTNYSLIMFIIIPLLPFISDKKNSNFFCVQLTVTMALQKEHIRQFPRRCIIFLVVVIWAKFPYNNIFIMKYRSNRNYYCYFQNSYAYISNVHNHFINPEYAHQCSWS